MPGNVDPLLGISIPFLICLVHPLFFSHRKFSDPLALKVQRLNVFFSKGKDKQYSYYQFCRQN